METEYNEPINCDGHGNYGLTKREWLAGLAMQWMLANSYQTSYKTPLSVASRHEIAQLATEQADALIMFMNKNPKNDQSEK